MLVIDASVAVKFVVEEIGSDSAYELVTSSEPLIAPDWLLAETANAIARKVKHQIVTAERAEQSLDSLPRFFSKLHPTLELIPAAFALSLRLEHAFYDCLYLALALAEETIVVTADQDFVSSCERAGMRGSVRLLGEEIAAR